MQKGCVTHEVSFTMYTTSACYRERSLERSLPQARQCSTDPRTLEISELKNRFLLMYPHAMIDLVIIISSEDKSHHKIYFSFYLKNFLFFVISLMFSESM